MTAAPHLEPRPAPPDTPTVLDVEDVVVQYGPAVAVDGVSLTLGAGERVALVGPNGAGKTSLLNAVCGVLKPTGGRIRIDGDDVTGAPPGAIVRRGITQVPEGRQVFAELSVRDNLELGAYAWSRGGVDREAEIERVFHLFPILRERSAQLAGTMSGGQQQMVAIGRALTARPRVLLLDEPSLGLAPLAVKSIFDVIVELKERGLAIVLVEQNARAALAMADRAYVLETGRVVAEGSGQSLLQDEQVRRSYLGYAVAEPVS